MVRSLNAKTLTSALALAASLSVTQARADATYGDWDVIDSACVARTTTSLNGSRVYSLTVKADPTGQMPLEIFIRPEDSKVSTVQGFRVAVDSTHVYSFAKLPRNEAGRDTFWNIPQTTMAFLAKLKSANQLNIDGLAGAGELPFSLAGATAALNRLQTKCAGASFAFTAAFEKDFAMSEVNQVDLARVTTEGAAALRALVQKSVVAYKGIAAVRMDIAALEDRYKKLTTEQAGLQTSLQDLNTTLKSLETSRDSAQSDIDAAISKIEDLKNSITTAKGDLTAARTAYAEAYATLKPLIPEHDRLQKIMASDLARLQQADDDVTSIQQSLADTERRIASLNDELQNLATQSDRNRQALRDASFELGRAEDDLRHFRLSDEIRFRLAQDSRLQKIDREIPLFQTAIRAQTEQFQQLTAERNSLAAALRQCETASLGAQPQPAQRPPSRDCSSQRRDLAGAEFRLLQAMKTLGSLQSQLNDRLQDRERIVSQIEADARAVQAGLEDRVQNARAQMMDLRQAERDIADRANRISTLELPQAQSEMTSLRTQLSRAQQALAEAQVAQTQSSRAFNAYQRSVNYEALDQRVQQAAARVDSIEAEVADLESQVTANERRIKTQTSAREALIARIDSTKAAIAQKTRRLAELGDLLKPYNDEKAAVLAKLAAAQKTLKDLQMDFLAQLPR